jgi:hypothetical protein
LVVEPVAGASFGKFGPALVMAVGAGRFAVSGLHELIGGSGLQHAGAILGLALAAVALYSALATEVEDVQGEGKLPLGRRAMAAEALRGPFDSQLQRIEHEAGVRAAATFEFQHSRAPLIWKAQRRRGSNGRKGWRSTGAALVRWGMRAGATRWLIPYQWP